MSVPEDRYPIILHGRGCALASFTRGVLTRFKRYAFKRAETSLRFARIKRLQKEVDHYKKKYEGLLEEHLKEEFNNLEPDKKEKGVKINETRTSSMEKQSITLVVIHPLEELSKIDYIT